MKTAYAVAGPSITITSLTDAIAFFLGAQTSLLGLRSFCVFSGIAVIILYLNCLTVFAALIVFDLKRQARLWPDCCGLCCCSEKSILCCRGSLLSHDQRKYSAYKGDNVFKPMLMPEIVKHNKTKFCPCGTAYREQKTYYDTSAD